MPTAVSYHSFILNDDHLRHAIAVTLTMWSDPQYRQFLRSKSPGTLGDQWFGWFVRSWSVSRTIKKGKQEPVRQHLDTVLRSELAAGKGADAIDDAARFIRDQGWSARRSLAGRASLPVSLVSKVGFLFRPHEITPSDNLARKGLDKLRREMGQGQLRDRSYREYLAAFDAEFDRSQDQIREALVESRATEMGAKSGCLKRVCASVAVQRKVLDSYLMEIGR